VPRTVPVYTAPANRFLTDFWGLFQELPVSDAVPPTATNALTKEVVGVDRVARLRSAPTGVGSPGNDRRLFLLDQSFEATDVEVYLTYSTEGAGLQQGGVVCRVKPGGSGHLAPTVWQNIIFAGTGTLLPGTWDFTGSVLTSTNQQATPQAFNGFPRVITSITGDGTTVTVTCAERHWLELGGLPAVSGSPLLPTNPQVTVSEIVSPFVFRAPRSEVGTQPGGRLVWVIWPPGSPRTIAARLVGSTITGKQYPAVAPEPSWADSVKTASVVLAAAPSGPGRPGFIVAHLGAASVFNVYAFDVNRLS
jgi:hypothetical protein